LSTSGKSAPKRSLPEGIEVTARQWDEVYRSKLNTMWYPNEDIIRFCARLMQKRLTYDRYEQKRLLKDVLDLGCGNGRHVTFFAQQGFRVAGIDISERAIEWARDWCRREGLPCDLRVGDITRLPFGDGTFDVAVSHGVLDHVPMEDARRAVEEVGRVLRSGGLFYCDLRSSEDFECGLGAQVGPNSFVLPHGFEAGLVQHFFTLQEAMTLVERLFRVVYIETNERRVGADLTRKFARWILASERL